MGWKNEMEKYKEEGQLAEGLMRTGNDGAADPPARPAQTVP
jgi:hypothetical protein